MPATGILKTMMRKMSSLKLLVTTLYLQKDFGHSDIDIVLYLFLLCNADFCIDVILTVPHLIYNEKIINIWEIYKPDRTAKKLKDEFLSLMKIFSFKIDAKSICLLHSMVPISRKN
jgi:hypothetical protein